MPVSRMATTVPELPWVVVHASGALTLFIAHWRE